MSTHSHLVLHLHRHLAQKRSVEKTALVDFSFLLLPFFVFLVLALRSKDGFIIVQFGPMTRMNLQLPLDPGARRLWLIVPGW
jgi:hypothetical protein